METDSQGLVTQVFRRPPQILNGLPGGWAIAAHDHSIKYGQQNSHKGNNEYTVSVLHFPDGCELCSLDHERTEDREDKYDDSILCQIQWRLFSIGNFSKVGHAAGLSAVDVISLQMLQENCITKVDFPVQESPALDTVSCVVMTVM